MTHETLDFVDALLSLGAFLVSLGALMYTWKWNSDSGKRQLTLNLLERWTNESHLEARDIAWEAFMILWSEQPGDPETKTVPRRAIDNARMGKHGVDRTDGVLAKHHFGNVAHFFVDLGRFAATGALDKKTSLAAFKYVSDTWFTVFDCTKWDAHGSWEAELMQARDTLYELWGEKFSPDTKRLEAYSVHYPKTRQLGEPSEMMDSEYNDRERVHPAQQV